MSVKVHEAFSLDSFADRLLFFDDFHGDQLQDEWNEAGTGSAAVVDAQTGGICRLTTGATTDDEYKLDWGGGVPIRSLLASKKATIETRAKPSTTANVDIIPCELASLTFTEMARIYFNSGDANYSIQTHNAGEGYTTAASDTAVDGDYHIFRIEFHTHGGAHTHFYIDGAELNVSPLTTSIPTVHMQPFLWIRTKENATKSLDVDYVYIRQER